jgi:phenylacetate-coenzyme A ligase PaaK-like adenylate-forming protein
MPLIRYRTGDISRLVPGPCPCGSVLKRLAPITRRKGGLISLGEYGGFTLADLDEALLAVGGVIGFTAAVDSAPHAARLSIAALAAGPPAGGGAELYAAADTVPAVRRARQAGRLTVDVGIELCRGKLPPGTAKRAIMELSEGHGQ